MDINDIRKRRALINRQISKGFNDNFSQENISKAYDDEFNKAHKVGDIHPNGKWVWTEIKPGKFDWRVIKKSKGSTVGSKVSSAATMSVNGGQSNVATKVKDIREAIVKLNIPRVGKAIETTIDGVKVEIRHNKATYTWPANISLKVGSENPKSFSYGSNSALAKYKNEAEATDNMFAELNKLLLKKYEVKPQAAKTPMQKNVDKQLVDAGFSVTGQNSKGGTIYRITDNTNLPNEFGQGWLPEVTMYNNGSIDVDIYESNSISKLNYTDKVASFGYGRFAFKSNNPNVIDLAKKLTSLIVYGDQDNFNCKYNESTEKFEVSVKIRGVNDFKHIGVIWVEPKGETVEYISLVSNLFSVSGVTPRFNKFSDLQKFFSHYSSLYAECKNAQKEVEAEKKLVAKKQAVMDAKRQKLNNFLRQQ